MKSRIIIEIEKCPPGTSERVFFQEIADHERSILNAITEVFVDRTYPPGIGGISGDWGHATWEPIVEIRMRDKVFHFLKRFL